MDEPDFAKILYEGHPADGTERAAYQFLISDPSTGAPVRFLLVEAENPWAVAALEKILLRDARVSDNCRIIAVFRDHRVAGVRDDLLEEVPFTDFMVDIVDPERLESQVVQACFSKSLEPKAREYVLGRIREAESGVHTVSRTAAPARRPAPVPALSLQLPPSGNAEVLTSALCNMGFKRAEVKKFVSSVGPRVESDPVPDLIREGLKSLAAA